MKRIDLAQAARRGSQKLRTLPRPVVLRFLLLLALLVAGALAVRFTPLRQYLAREALVQALDQLSTAWWAPWLLVLLHGVVALVGIPTSPVLLAGGVVFDAFYGTVLNLLGLFLGAALSYWVAGLLGRDFVAHLLGPSLRRIERAFEQRGFWPLVQVRFLPIPFALINYGAALTGVRPAKFLVTSVVGLTPATLMHTFFIAKIYRASDALKLHFTIAYFACWGLFALLTSLPTIRQSLARRARHRELIARRRTRTQAS